MYVIPKQEQDKHTSSSLLPSLLRHSAAKNIPDRVQQVLCNRIHRPQRWIYHLIGFPPNDTIQDPTKPFHLMSCFIRIPCAACARLDGSPPASGYQGSDEMAHRPRLHVDHMIPSKLDGEAACSPPTFCLRCFEKKPLMRNVWASGLHTSEHLTILSSY